MKGWSIRILVTVSKLQRKAAQAVPMRAPSRIDAMPSRMAVLTVIELAALCGSDDFTERFVRGCLGLPKKQLKQRCSG